MHPLFFGVKRVHYCAVRLTQWALNQNELETTPARLDLLRAIYVYPNGIPRWKLVKVLGVSGPVISRMLVALEAQGLLRRRRVERDRRLVWIDLTLAGKQLVGMALLMFIEGVELEDWVRDSFTSASPSVHELEILERFLLRARRYLRDKAALAHPWVRSHVDEDRVPWPLPTCAPPSGGSFQPPDAWRWDWQFPETMRAS
jgi:DNA-binding MarR family transcriptional regulator